MAQQQTSDSDLRAALPQAAQSEPQPDLGSQSPVVLAALSAVIHVAASESNDSAPEEMHPPKSTAETAEVALSTQVAQTLPEYTNQVPGELISAGVSEATPQPEQPRLSDDEVLQELISAGVSEATPQPEQPRLSDDEVLEKSRTLWRELDPEDETDPVEATDKQELSDASGARMIGASRRGRSHAHDGKYREDSFVISTVNGWMLAAVADGTGSKPLARVGSRLAAQAAIAYLQREMHVGNGEEDVDQALRGALAGAMGAAHTSLIREAARRRRAINDFASTLLLVAYRPAPNGDWLGVAQVGDGGVIACLEGGECKPLAQADHGQFAGESVFLTSAEAQNTWPQRVYTYQFVNQHLRRLIVATDGVMDDFSPPYGAYDLLFTQLEPLMTEPQADVWLLNWLAYERRGSFDDRTVVVLAPSPPAAAGL